MTKYNVKISNQAEKDLNDIIMYIKYCLQEPKISKNIYKKIMYKINQLEINPKKYQIVDEIMIKKLDVRKMTVNNYLIFYKVYDSEKIVYVVRIMYAKRNWKEIL